MLLHVTFIQADACGFNCELAAIGHGIARISGQVHDDLLDLHGIGAHTPNIATVGNGELKVLADQPRQHFADFLEHMIQIKQLQGLHLLAAEGQQLASQISGALGGFHDFLHITQ